MTKEQGYTLLEILVATAVIGILFILSAAIILNTIRNNNQSNITNEIRENVSLVADTFERDVRKAFSAVVSQTDPTLTNDTLTLTQSDRTITWQCHKEDTANTTNGYISRLDSTSGVRRPVTNRDPTNGVSWNGCSFTRVGTSDKFLINLDFTLTEGAAVHTSASEFIVSINHKVSAGNRGF